MQKSTMLTGSICLTDLINQCKTIHPAFNKASNGKIYVNVTQFMNEYEDQFGNIASLQLQKKKDDDQNPVYIGNFKQFKQPEINSNDLEMLERESIEINGKNYSVIK